MTSLLRLRRAAPAAFAAWFAPRAIAVFRLCCGIGLALYFADHFTNSVDLIAVHGLYDESTLRALGVPIRSAAWLPHGSPAALRTVFAAAVVLCVPVALGALQRIGSAILFVLGVLTARALYPVSHLDDYLAAATLFWLTLLPSAAGPLSRTFWRADTPSRPSDGTVVVFVTSVCLTYFGLGLGTLADPGLNAESARLPLLGCFLLPALVIAPGTWPRAIGPAVQATLHGYFLLTKGAAVSHLLLLATGILLWAPLRPTPERPRITAAVVVGAAQVVLFAAVQLLPRIHQPLARPAMARLLFDIGLFPPEREPLPDAPFALQVSLPGRPESIVRSDHVRFQLLLARLSAPASSAEQATFRQELGRRLLVRYCAAGTNTTPGSALILAPSGNPTRWEFTCPGGES